MFKVNKKNQRGDISPKNFSLRTPLKKFLKNWGARALFNNFFIRIFMHILHDFLSWAFPILRGGLGPLPPPQLWQRIFLIKIKKNNDLYKKIFRGFYQFSNQINNILYIKYYFIFIFPANLSYKFYVLHRIFVICGEIKRHERQRLNSN